MNIEFYTHLESGRGSAKTVANPYKRRKVAHLTVSYQSFVNLKSNTMKKSRCKNTAKSNTLQTITVNNHALHS